MPSASHWASAVLCSVLLAGCTTDSRDAPRTGIARLPVIGGVIDDGPGANDAVVVLVVGQGACSATLVAPNLVITARHCVSQVISQSIACDPSGKSLNGDHVGADVPPESIRVFTGLAPQLWAGTPDAIGSQIFHPEGQILCNSDIALVVLDQPIPGIEPRKLRLEFGAQIGELVMVVGYGQTDASPWSSGVRHRRGDIPVVSSGFDWNYLSGSKEFVLGQSTCQGDSGGPALAMTTGALVGLTSRGGDCFTDMQHFTRVDRHAALIQEAFEAAGQVPLLEGVPAPPPLELKETGEGPCEVGAECKSGACLNDGGTSYCSIILCSPQQCRFDMICLPTPFADFTQDVPACVWIPEGDACESCRYDKCKSELERCYQEDECRAIAECADTCSTDACREACVLQDTSGKYYWEPLRNCTCQYKCVGLCEAQCGGGEGGAAGQAGAGGAAGASGTGGGAGTGGAKIDAGAPRPVEDSSGDEGGCSITSGGMRARWFDLVLGCAFVLLIRRRGGAAGRADERRG